MTSEKSQLSISERETARTGGIQICACLESGVPLPLNVEEIARGDVRLTTDRPLKFGTRLTMAIFLDFLSGSVPNRGVVHWCRPSVSGWQLGIFLNSPIPESMMSRSWWELRDSIRYACNWPAWLSLPNQSIRQPIRILNYSLCGIKISCDASLSIGTEFGICTSSSEHSPPTLVGRVERTDVAPSQFGCYLPHETGRFLPGVFNQSSALHIETPCTQGMNTRTSLLPEMIDKLPTGGFASADGSYQSNGS